MRTILVIDDDELFRDAICAAIADPSYEIHQAANGKQAIEIATSHIPDLIITDLSMNTLDGFSVIGRLRKDIATATIPIVVMTGLPADEAYRKCMELGADDFLSKPFEPARLRAAIKARFERADSELAHQGQKLDELRSMVSRSLPHEFRTPLAIIAMAADLLETSDAIRKDADLSEIVSTLKAGADRLRHLTENFVLFSRVELWHGDADMKQFLRRERFTISALFLAALAADHAGRNDRPAEDYRVSVEPAELCMSEAHAHIVVSELIDNAFRFSKAGTPVDIKGKKSGSTFELDIHDAGRGMKIADIKDVGAFMQFGRELHEQQGVGLGLTIAKRLIELYGGTLRIDSSPGSGTRVEVRLPCSPEG